MARGTAVPEAGSSEGEIAMTMRIASAHLEAALAAVRCE